MSIKVSKSFFPRHVKALGGGGDIAKDSKHTFGLKV